MTPVVAAPTVELTPRMAMLVWLPKPLGSNWMPGVWRTTPEMSLIPRVERGLAQRGDRLRHFAQRFGPAGGRHHDFARCRIGGCGSRRAIPASAGAAARGSARIGASTRASVVGEG
jgi:hypothetical protein